ncbi:hypothetical protein UYSO10_4467 [Kosakonia radicincitans]|uniref:baseplate complex protein n=1 Tax=Kosakonia radicincitans TaxID=283686 RepID=UPI001181D7F1|nr:hypothetical protein [Kosakonia radicincitans]VVT52948.1 hypothetical protein UYSO10_4467 [Kosakonia radicincitans]
MTMTTTLALNGEAIPLKGIRVTLSQQFPDKDQSGQTSATSKAEQGAKGKELRINGEIAFKDVAVLRRLFQLANATDSGGKRVVYRVANDVARAVNLREATFSGTIDAPQQDGRMSWAVTFTLSEQLSVAEKKEAARTTRKTSTAQTAGGSGSGTDAAEDAEKMTWFERKVLKPVNDALG